MQNKIKNKGFVFTFEAIFALLLFALMLFSIPIQDNSNLKELLIIQKANDLLRVWSQDYPNEMEMIIDTKTVFQNTAKVKINDKELVNFTCSKVNQIATEGILLDDLLIENKITIIVCYE